MFYPACGGGRLRQRLLHRSGVLGGGGFGDGGVLRVVAVGMATPEVFFQVERDRGRVLTQVTCVRLLSGVDPHMYRQLRRFREALVTNSTLVWLLVSVGSQVKGQMMRVRK